MKLSDKISNWIKRQVKEANAKGIVLGLSGGIDSASVAVLAKKAIGDKVLALILTCQSDPKDEEYAQLVAEKFNIRIKKVSLDQIYDKFAEILPRASKMAQANLKPRLRMIVLYYFANNLNYLVAGTGNKSEITVGYFTKYGDGGVDILPLGGLLKTEVRELAKEIGIPKEIIERVPTAGLWQGQTDEGEMGVSYEDLDRAIITIESGRIKNIPKDILSKVKKMMRSSLHKRLTTPVFNKK